MTISRKHYSVLFALFSLFLLIGTFVPYKFPERLQFLKANFRLDYLLHVVAFCFLSFILLHALPKTWLRFPFILLSLVSLMFFSIGLEYLQRHSAHHTFNSRDLYCNVAGIVLGVIVWLFMGFRKRAGG